PPSALFPSTTLFRSAYCRVVDDIVDRPPGFIAPEAALTRWLDLSRKAYAGQATGIPLIDRVMHDMAEAGVPFELAAELAEGMRIDRKSTRLNSSHVK